MVGALIGALAIGGPFLLPSLFGASLGIEGATALYLFGYVPVAAATAVTALVSNGFRIPKKLGVLLAAPVLLGGAAFAALAVPSLTVALFSSTLASTGFFYAINAGFLGFAAGAGATIGGVVGVMAGAIAGRLTGGTADRIAAGLMNFKMPVWSMPALKLNKLRLPSISRLMAFMTDLRQKPVSQKPRAVVRPSPPERRLPPASIPVSRTRVVLPVPARTRFTAADTSGPKPQGAAKPDAASPRRTPPPSGGTKRRRRPPVT
ncbi:MAG: hypothetical protein EBQ96_03840 [Proteobacteria bacterium]|nr:hypothetical protein [Pseudomonadota bacterium]